MKIENQVCTLQQAKDLKRLGVEQKPANYFWDESDGQLYRCADGSASDIGCFAAFTVAEMGVMFPDGQDIKRMRAAQLLSYRIAAAAGGGYYCEIPDENGEELTPPLFSTKGITEAQARAAMLIHLLESGRIILSAVNQRLYA